MVNLHPRPAHIMPQNGERVVTMDSVTLFHPIYFPRFFQAARAASRALPFLSNRGADYLVMRRCTLGMTGVQRARIAIRSGSFP